MWSTEDKHNCILHICAKGFLHTYRPNIKFSPNCLKFHIFTKIQTPKVFKNRLTNCFHSANFMAGTCKESTIFIFGSCQPECLLGK